MDSEPQNLENTDSLFVWDEKSQLYFHARFFSTMFNFSDLILMIFITCEPLI
jgi:hypothetical protein